MAEIAKVQSSKGEEYEKTLLNVVSNPDSSNYLLLYLRLVTSAYIKTHRELFMGFVTGDSVEDYCSREIEHFDHDCDHIQILALTSYLDIGVTIYVPREEGQLEVNRFPEGAAEFPISMLYLPGHYDPLYAI